MGVEENGETSTPSVGVILPPPEVRNIVDRTAMFVAKNGAEFAERIRKEKEGEPKFQFLMPTSPYHAYYLHKVDDFRKGATLDLSAKDKDTSFSVASLKEEVPEIELHGPPPEPQFLFEAPTLYQQDVDLVRLTAQFVARNGRDFLTRLIQQEANNYQFDFLKPHHVLFTFFQKMVEQYSKVYMVPADLKARLEADAADSFQILDRVTYAVEWQRQMNRIREQEQSDLDAERTAYAQIDWNEFVVVQTIDFTPADTDLPGPITINQLAQRLLDMDRIDRPEIPAAPVAHHEAADVEMEVDEPAPKPVAPAPRQLAPPAPTVDIKIRKDYDPKAGHRGGASEPMQVSPLTGELIPVSKMAEHMRIGLLDPKWKEQKDRYEAELSKTRNAPQQMAVSAMANLKEMAAHRGDVFGMERSQGGRGGEEQQMSSAARLAALAGGPAPVPRPAPVPQPTHTYVPAPQPPAPQPMFPPAFMPPAPVAAPAPVHVPAPIAAPTPVAPAPVAPAPAAPMPAAPSIGRPAMLPTPGPAMPPAPQRAPLLANAAPRPMGMMPPAMAAPMAAPPVTPSFTINAAPVLSEPPSKRPKAESFVERLEPEAQFLATHHGGTVVTVYIGEADPKFNLVQGQQLQFSVNFTDKIGDLKQKLQDQCGMPINKQKIMIDDVVLTNTNSIAFYNITPGTMLFLGAKTRGGRK
eukprot:m.231853 g.231853  ORF g.231853 m.231853 type:complete len:692 (+) comp12270_c0_seq1:22-2097(+)